MQNKQDIVPAETLVAVIGCGNMGGALIRGFCTRVFDDPQCIIACDQDASRVDALVEEFGVRGTTSAADAVKSVDIVIIALKPAVVLWVVSAIAPALRERRHKPLLVSVAAGVQIEALQGVIGDGFRLVRVMPNIAATIGEGVSGVYADDPEDRRLVESLFSAIGITEGVASEGDLDTVTGLSGSGPAFVCMLIEALADGGVKMGLPREKALPMAVQTVRGAAAFVAESGMHPAEVKDKVASPGGTTIAGLHVLEQGGLRGMIVSAVEAATQRARDQLKK